MNSIHKDLIASGHALAKEMTGVAAALIKELATQLDVQRVRADVLMKERDDARTALSSALLTISQITDVVGTSDSLSISQQVAGLAKSATEHMAQGVEKFAEFCGEENSVFVEAKAYYRYLPDAADEFAAQLRKEAGNG